MLLLKIDYVLQLYHIGGVDDQGSAVREVYTYEDISDRWLIAMPLPQALHSHTCTVVNCHIVVCGGRDSTGVR